MSPAAPMSPRANAPKRRIRSSALGAITAPPQPIGNHGSSTLTTSPPQPMSPRANATKRRIRTSALGAITAPPQPMSPLANATQCDSSDAFAVMVMVIPQLISVHRQLHTLYVPESCSQKLQIQQNRIWFNNLGLLFVEQNRSKGVKPK